MLEERIINLEIKFSHQEMLLEQLNLIVTEQQMVIEKMLSELKELKLAQPDQGAQQRSLKDEVPPHY
jgi:SlyX protein